MKIKNIILVFFLSFILIGCGENNSDTPADGSGGVNNPDNTNSGTNDNSLIIEDRELVRLSFKNANSAVVSTNNQVVTIDVQAFDNDNAPYSEGSIKIIYPNKAISGGTDVGSFDASEKALVDGRATFTYTAPDELQKRVDEGDTGSVFGFYHSSDKNTTIQAYTFTYAPEADQITLTDYELKHSYAGDEPTLGLESTMQLSFYVQDKKNNKLPDASIVSMNIQLLNTAFAELKDTSGRVGSSLLFNDKNDVSVSLVSNTKSGIVPLKVTTNFIDVNGDSKTLSRTFSVIVLSGPPTAMSLSYSSTRNEKERAKFVEKWVLSVTDKYNNPVNTHPSVSMGMIAGYAASSVANDTALGNLYYEPTLDYANVAGRIIDNGTSDQLTASASVFGDIDPNNDVLVTFGEGYRFNASGKWDFTKVNSTTLTLIDNFEGETTENLAFAVGHNFRDETCRFAKKALGIVYPQDGIFTIDDTGSMVIEVEYDYYLVGKNVVLWANIVADHNANSLEQRTTRIGHAQVENLRGLGLDEITHIIKAGVTEVVYKDVKISDTTEWYRNGKLGYEVQVTGQGNSAIVKTSAQLHGVDSCVNGGVAFVEINVTSAGSDGSVDLSNMLVGEEF